MMVLWLLTGSPRREPTAQHTLVSLVSSSSRKGRQVKAPCFCYVCVQCYRKYVNPTFNLGPVFRHCVSPAPRRVARPQTAQDNHSESSRQTGRDTLMSVPRERHSTPPPRNSRQSANRALAINLRDTASAIARLLAPTCPRPSSRPPN